MNHLTHKTYQRARDLILASEGRTLEDELGFGCLVNYSTWKNCKIVGRGVESKDNYVVSYEYSNKSRFASVNVERNYFEILGLPISLERVLSSIRKPYTIYKHVEKDGVILIVCDDIRMDWCLNLTLHEQPQEVWEKLIEILGESQLPDPNCPACDEFKCKENGECVCNPYL